MKFLYHLLKPSLFALAAFVIFSESAAQGITTPPGGGNQRSVTKQYIGSMVYVEITYNSPDVTAPNGDDRKGQIWGQLVPYGLTDLGFGLRNPSPWRAGANENTIITFSHDVTVQGKPIKAGTYGLHIVVEESGPWKVIFSNNSGAWGSFFYDPAEDALQVEATAEDAEYHEWLTYEFIDRQPESTTVAMMWENKKLPFRVEVPNMKDLYVAKISNELQTTPGFQWQNWNNAANYLLNNGEDSDMELALTWSESAISAPFIGQKNFQTLSTKSQVLARMGKADEAEKVMDEAIAVPGTPAVQIHQYGRTLIAQGKKDKALEVFKMNAKVNKDTWPVNYGLARGYSALGSYKTAIKYIELAKKNCPAGPQMDALIANLEKLKKNEDIN